VNNGWCFSPPKLTHAQPEIYLKNHVKTHPCNPFMLLHMRHNGIAGDGAQIFHWKKKHPFTVPTQRGGYRWPDRAIHDHQPRYVFWAKVQTA
jgi:hypothetical protein